VPTQFIRQSIHPAVVICIVCIVLIGLLSGFLWWSLGKTDPSPDDTGTKLSTLSSEPLHDTDPARTISTHAPPEEEAPPAFIPEQVFDPDHEPEFKPGLMSIPSLPTNQQQGRHNRYDLSGIDDNKSLSSYQPPAPVTPASAPLRKQTTAVATEHKADAYDEAEDAPPPMTRNSRSAAPPWLRQLRRDLANCQDLFCRERVRARYCTSQWENLTECKGASL
jgi:hypothetical protein